MKYLILSLLILAGCDQPQLHRTRGASEFSATGVEATIGASFSDEGDVPLGAGYESCNFQTTRSTLSSIKDISICKNSSQNNYSSQVEVKVKFGDQDYVDGTCFIPTTKYSNGSSAYVGIAQCTYHADDDVLTGEMIKNRPGFESSAINAVMIMKKASINAYFDCMDEVPRFLATQSVTYLGSPYTCSYIQSTNCSMYASNQAQYDVCNICLSAANNSKNQKCSNFQVQHQYIDWNL